ncbi:MAG: carboxypeptidase regulatory-like domain-containing protein [Candidatus Thermoplasmatota archaeon]|jgi:hypothetical protein|nr:carboxypeptidase regulatory-like domain-containing protein [Candidatus Thermoplasmatota archaeon]
MKTSKRSRSFPFASFKENEGPYHPRIGFRNYVLLFSIFLILASTISFSASSESNPPEDDGAGTDLSPGDGIFTTEGLWDIEDGDEVEYSNMKILTNGSLAVRSGATLNLTNVTLFMGTNVSAKPIIDVFNQGELNLINCTIAPASTRFAYSGGFAFRFRAGSLGSVMGTNIYGMNTSFGVGLHGMLVQSSNIRIENSTFNSSQTGISIVSCSPVIKNSYFHHNGIGLAIYATSTQMSVEDCNIYDNTIGVYAIGASNVRFEMTTIYKNVEGVQCLNTNFLARYPSFIGCTIRDNEEYGLNITNSRCLVSTSQISNSDVGLRAERCVGAVSPTINGSTISGCDIGLLINYSRTVVTTSTFSTCKTYVSASNGSIFDLTDLVIQGGGVGGSNGFIMDGSRGNIERCSIGPLTNSFISTDSTVFSKNTTIANPTGLFLDIKTSDLTMLNTTTHPDEVNIDDASMVIEGGFHDIHIIKKNGDNVSWQTFEISSLTYSKEFTVDYDGFVRDVSLVHGRIGNDSVNFSYGKNTIQTTYQGRVNVHEVYVVEGTDIIVIRLNAPPEATKVELEPSLPQTEDALEANWTFSDADEDDEEMNRTLTWFMDGNVRVELNNITSVDPSLTAKDQEWYFTLSVSDGEFWSNIYVSDKVIIDNTPPLIDDIQDVNIYQGDELLIPIKVRDPDDDGLDVVLISDAEGAILTHDDSSIVFSPTIHQVRTFHFELRVSDGTEWVNSTFNVTVRPRSTLGSVTFRVTGPTGPLTNVNITGGIVKMVTNETGEVTFKSIYEGINNFGIWKKGYWAIDHEVMIEGGNAIFENITLLPMPTTEFSLTVHDSSNNFVTGTNMTLKFLSFEVPGLSIPMSVNASLWTEHYVGQGWYETDSEGVIFIPDLAVGKYLITMRKEGYDTYRTTLFINDTNQTVLTVPLLKDIERKIGYVEGTVMLPSGKLMRGIVIEFQLKDTPRTTETDENGFYEIELPRGVYDVRVIVKGYRTYIDEVVVLPNENLVQDIELETLESGSEEDENQFARGFSFFILVVIINLMIALYFVTFHKKKVIKSADEIIGEEDSKRKQEKEKRDDVYRKKIYTPETLELKEEEEKPLKEVEKQKKEMAILDKIIEKGRYVDKGEDFVHTGYGAVFKEYMESDEIEFIDEDVEWGGGEGTPDESEDEGIDEDLFDEYGQRIRRDKDEAFDWAD